MPKKNPSTRWFFKDWHNDEALQLCSLAARGLWIELLGICAENDGYLLINGTPPPPSSTRLARYIGGGTTRQAIAAALKELEQNGVFSRTPEGVIFNRRMVRSNGSCSDGIRTDHTRDSTISQTPDLLDEKPPLARNAHARVPAHRKLSKALAKKDSESTSNTESLNAARANTDNREEQWTRDLNSCASGLRCGPDAASCTVTKASNATSTQSGESGESEGKAGKNDEEESFERPKGALEPRPDEPIMETPVGTGPAGACKGESDGDTSLPSPASDYRDPALKRKCRSDGPAGTCDRSFDEQASKVPVHHYPISWPAGQDRRDSALNGEGQPETVDLPRRGRPARAARPRPPPAATLKAKKPDFVKFQLLPKKQGNAFLEHGRYDLLADYFAAVDLNHETKTPRNPIAFQHAIDAASAFIKRDDWTAQSPFDPAPPTPVPKLDNAVLRRPGQSTWNAIAEQCRA